MLQPGTVLQQRYRVVKMIAQGGMSSVYRAWDLRLNVAVALKEATPQPNIPPNLLAQQHWQFQQEAILLAQLNHPNLVRVLDFFQVGDGAYLVMELIAGEQLDHWVERVGPLPEETVRELALPLLDALYTCHDQNVLHRDVKPQNIIIRPDGQPVLVDFGLVKLWDPHSPDTRTVIQGMGTLEFAPPEQYGLIQGHTDVRSDLYSLGATLFYALSGKAPTAATLRMATPQSHISIKEAAPQVSKRMVQVVGRAIELEPDARYASAQAMRAALTRASGGGKRSVWWAVGIIVILVLAFFGRDLVGWLSQATPTPTAVPDRVIEGTATPLATATFRPTVTPVESAKATATSTPGADATLTVHPGVPSTATERAPTVTSTPVFYARVNTNELNVRGGPGTDYKILSLVYEGNCLPVYGQAEGGDWLLVDTARGRGWIAKAYVVTDASPRCDSATPTPVHLVNSHFRVDRTTLKKGDCTTLRWDADGIKALYFEGTGRAGHSTEYVCPPFTNTYTLRIIRQDGDEEFHTLTIYVSNP